MVLVKILKRRDGSSIVVGVVLALIINQLLSAITAVWANMIVSSPDYTNNNFNEVYLVPLLAALLAVVALEVLCWLYIWTLGATKKR